MTLTEYRDYQASFAAFLETEGIDSFTCDRHGDESQDDHVTEFSSRPCEACDTRLAGERHRVSAYHAASGEVLKYEVCSDCVYYAEYGQLDDMTMMDMEEEPA